MKKQELQSNEYNQYYQKYIDQLADDTDLINGLASDKEQLINYFKSIDSNKLEYRYQPEKWTIKEVFQHLIDTERVFTYRCFTIGRQDKTQLPGFDENEYVPPSEANKKSLQTLIDEFSTTRDFTLSIFKSLSDKNLKEIGNANGGSLSARACGFIILAHELWHIKITNERYL